MALPMLRRVVRTLTLRCAGDRAERYHRFFGDDHTRRSGCVDHLYDRQRLAAAAANVALLEPVETAVEVVDDLLLRQDEHEPVAVSELTPPRVGEVVVSGLGAAV